MSHLMMHLTTGMEMSLLVMHLTTNIENVTLNDGLITNTANDTLMIHLTKTCKMSLSDAFTNK